MPPFPPAVITLNRRQLLSWLPLLATPWAGAQTKAGSNDPVDLSGRSSDGQPLGLKDLRGQVVLVFFWSTGCAVCRDKMHELRANIGGWQGQPFALLGVNMDTRLADLLTYENLLRQTVPAPQRLRSIWGADPSFVNSLGTPAQLPSAHLIDKQGRLVESHSGRIPPEAWDRISELL